MWLLIGLSGVSMYLMIERAIFFFQSRSDVGALSSAAGRFLARCDTNGLARRISGEKGVAAQVLAVGLAESGRGAMAAEQSMSGELTKRKKLMERNLSALATIGNNAPFIGLFGTVIGVLVAFQRFSADMNGGAGTIMADISEALAATAIGLFVAIPAVAAYNAFGRQAKAIVADTESLSAMLLSHLKGEPRAECTEPDDQAEPSPGGGNSGESPAVPHGLQPAPEGV
jgi:biopolymer transport protein ExbB